jgi:PAS domain S-box-containing protein
VSRTSSHDELLRPSVLLAEDSDPQRRLIAAMLNKNGFQVFEAADGLLAMDLLQSAAVLPSVILSDIGMPNLNGISLCRQVKESPVLGHLPVVMLTGLDNSRNEVAAIEAGADEFLSKPVDENQLVIRLHSAIKLAKLRAPDGDSWLREVFERLPAAVIVADDRARVVDANPAAARLLGYSKQEIIDMNLDLTPARSSDGQARPVKRRSWRKKTLVRTKFGSVMTLDVNGSMGNSGGRDLYVAVLREAQ